MESIFSSNNITFIFEFFHKTAFKPFLFWQDAYASVVPFAAQKHNTVIRAKRNGSFVQVSSPGLCCLWGTKKVKLVFIGHIWYHSNTPNLYEVAKVWKTLDVMKIKLCALSGSDVLFREQRQVVQLESWYLIRSMNFSQLPPENCNLHSFLYLRGKKWDWVDNRQFC